MYIDIDLQYEGIPVTVNVSSRKIINKINTYQQPELYRVDVIAPQVCFID